MAAPGRHVQLKSKEQAPDALGQGKPNGGQLESRHAACEKPRGCRRHHENGRDQESADGVDRRDDRDCDRCDEQAVRHPRLEPQRGRDLRVETGGDPGAPARGRGRQHGEGRDERGEQLVVADGEQAAEEETVDARPRVEDVACQDDPDRQRRDQEERRRDVPPQAANAAEALQPRRVGAAYRQRGERRRDSGGPRDHQAGEGGGPDGVREEGEVPQDDLRADDARQRRQQHDLERRPLHEREAERVDGPGHRA